VLTSVHFAVVEQPADAAATTHRDIGHWGADRGANELTGY